MSKIAIQGNPLGSGLFTITSANSNSDYAITIPAQTGTLVLGDGSGGLSLSGSLTLSGGTANGVLYLNGSKVATSGSALTFDGTTFTSGAHTLSSGNLNFGTTAQRITGDFSNATFANRVAFQDKYN